MIGAARAAKRFFDQRIGWNRVGIALSVTIIVIAAIVLYRMLRGISVYEVAPPGVDSELGRERWSRTGATSHGGMPVADFVAAMLAALEQDQAEFAVGEAEGMRAKREALFPVINR